MDSCDIPLSLASLPMRHLGNFLFSALLLAGSNELSGVDFEISDGLDAKPAVTADLVSHPLTFTLDDRGRLYVTELKRQAPAIDSSASPVSGQVSQLEDTNADGIFDKATVFADQLGFPQGAVWVDDSLYVLAPPELWRFSDRDDDGYADVREIIATGFGTSTKPNDAHGPFIHPNGRLYWTQGRHEFSIPDQDTGVILDSGSDARLWTSWISGSDIETFAGGGIDNPTQIDFTDSGEIIGAINLFQTQPRVDALTHWIYQGNYPRTDQKKNLAGFTQTGTPLPPISHLGDSNVSGLHRYRSGILNQNWTDQWFATHLNGASVTRTRLSRTGSTYDAIDTETIFRLLRAGSHLTDVTEDHNGDLLVIDTGDWFLASSESTDEQVSQNTGTIYRISNPESPYRAPSYPEWNQLTAEEVANLLSAEEDWIQAKAITELAVRGAPSIPELRRLLMRTNTTAQARRNAVWTLARMKFSESADLIFEALKDQDPDVRQAACGAISVTRTWQNVAANQPAERNVELERNRTISGALAEIVRADDAPVARTAAVALGRMGEFRSIGAILGRLGRVEKDRFLEHSLIYALIEIDDFETTRGALSSGNSKIINGVLHALNEMPSAQLEIFDVLPFLDSSDPNLRDTVIAIAGEHPDWDAGLANRFFDWTEDLNEARKATLAGIIPPMADSPPVADYLTSLIESDHDEISTFGLELLSLAPKVRLRSEWKPLLKANLALDADEIRRSLTLDVLLRHRDLEFKAQVKALSNSPDIPRRTRDKAREVMESFNQVNRGNKSPQE